MKTLSLIYPRVVANRNWLPFSVAVLSLVLFWQMLPLLLQGDDSAAGLVDGGIWQLLLFGIIAFFSLLVITAMLFKWLLALLALPTINTMVSQFKNLQLWQQFVLYWALFALLFLGGLLSLMAIF